MKKLFILPVLFALSACACWSSDEPEETKVVYRSSTAVAEGPRDCDYFDADTNTCYKYRRQVQPQYVAAPAPVRYREPVQYRNYRQTTVRDCVNCNAPAPAPVPVAVPAPAPVSYVAADDNSPCPPKIRETREPVEIVYKKTTYKTVYEPRTTSSVRYEKEPYNGGAPRQVNHVGNDYVEVTDSEDLIVEQR